MDSPHPSIMQSILNSSELTNGFPPSFEGNSWIFISALFCTMIATLVSFVQIYSITREIANTPAALKSPISIYRIQLMLMYMVVLFGAGPDAVYLWTYGEVSAETTSNILNFDRVFDSLFIIPFSLFTWLQLKFGSVLRFQLLWKAPPSLDFHNKVKDVRLNIISGVMILLMSIGVTLSK